MQRVVDVSEEDNKAGTEKTRKKKGAATANENLTVKKLALMKAKEDRGLVYVRLIVLIMFGKPNVIHLC